MNHASSAAAALDLVRRDAPLVHSITNYVAMDVTANALLAVGASPAMIHAAEEVEDFVGLASALVINIGTLSPPWVDAMMAAAKRAGMTNTPWVLDPVGAGATPYRTSVAQALSRQNPTVVRGNASEILALAGEHGAVKGVDSTDSSEAARELAVQMANDLGCVVAVTGAVDYITDGDRLLAVANGHPMMTKVTALGCTATALIGAFLGVTSDATAAAAYALAVLGLAGETAAGVASGPGTLRLHLIDALYNMDGAAIEAGARIDSPTERR
jgi:hydroxyethylthiazole kinase